jgi:hypothetical protein
MQIKRHARRVLLEGLGWLLVVAGLAALVLPGPGLLALFAGLALLSTQYEWAERRLAPVQKAALKAAADGVSNWPRIVASVAASGLIIAAGIIWGIHPAAPSWWFLANKLWLIGGWGTGGTLIGSGLIALIMIMYSFRRFRN